MVLGENGRLGIEQSARDVVGQDRRHKAAVGIEPKTLAEEPVIERWACLLVPPLIDCVGGLFNRIPKIERY